MKCEEYATFRDYLSVELAMAQREYDVAKNHFENAIQEFSEIAILKLQSAERRLIQIIQERRDAENEQKNNDSRNNNHWISKLYRNWRAK